MDGVCVAGPASFLVNGQKRFSCVALIFVCEFLVGGTGMVIIFVDVGAEHSRHVFPLYWRSFRYSLALLSSLKKSEASAAVSPVVAGLFLSG